MSRDALAVLTLSSLCVLFAMGCKNATTGPLGAVVSLTMPFEAQVDFPPETRDRVYSLPRQGGGPMTAYDVPLGSLLQSYAADYLGAAFDGGLPIEVQIEIDSFRVRNYQAFLVASFQVTKDEYPVFEKSYTVMGSRRVQQNDSDTAFEGKQAVDLSIDEVMRSLFAKFLKDARSASLTW
jgi:hypothetical protein